MFSLCFHNFHAIPIKSNFVYTPIRRTHFEKNSSGEETFIEHDEEILNQLICGEETVDICCTTFAKQDQCEGFDKESCDEVSFNLPNCLLFDPNTCVIFVDRGSYS